MCAEGEEIARKDADKKLLKTKSTLRLRMSHFSALDHESKRGARICPSLSSAVI
jgi:hypothetical protein